MIDLTTEVLTDIAKLPTPTRKRVMEELGRQEWDRCAADPMYWIDAKRHSIPYVYTQDPKPLYVCKKCNDIHSIGFDKRITHLKHTHDWDDDRLDNLTNYDFDTYFDALPTTRSFTVFPYMEPIIKTWLREKIVCIDKSRDMMITWLIVTLYMWDTLFHKNRENIFQSDDASKACELVRRGFFIWNNQPAFLRDVHPAEFAIGQSKSGILQVPSLASKILGFPQGPEQIRMYHPSGIFQDEAAFQIQAEAAFTACKPAIQAGGRFTAVSSANPGWFYRVCKDITE